MDDCRRDRSSQGILYDPGLHIQHTDDFGASLQRFQSKKHPASPNRDTSSKCNANPQRDKVRDHLCAAVALCKFLAVGHTRSPFRSLKTPEGFPTALFSSETCAQNATALREAISCYQSLGTELTVSFTSHVNRLVKRAAERVTEESGAENPPSTVTGDSRQSSFFFLGLGNCVPIVSAAQVAAQLNREAHADVVTLTACTVFTTPAIRKPNTPFYLFNPRDLCAAPPKSVA